MDSNKSIQHICTPEDVCAYDSMLAAHQRLMDLNIRSVTRHGDVAAIISKLKVGPKYVFFFFAFVRSCTMHISIPFAFAQVAPVASVAGWLEKQLLSMPWLLTRNFSLAVYVPIGF